VVKTDSDDDPIAIMSVLSTGKYKEARFMKQILQFLLDSCPKQAPGTRLAELCKQVCTRGAQHIKDVVYSVYSSL